MVQDQQQGAPGKPFFLYFAFGAMHAPHHVAPEWVDPYRGVFDKGWDAWREELFARQVASGIVPEGTVLTPRPEWVQAWSDLSADERRMHARQQEVFAGFLTHTDAQIGRAPLVAREPRGRWTTRSSWSSPTTGPAPRAARRAPSTSTASPPMCGSRWPRTWPATTTGAGSAPTTTTRGPGPGPATPRTSSGSATPGWAGRARRSSCTGGAASPVRARCGRSSPTSST